MQVWEEIAKNIAEDIACRIERSPYWLFCWDVFGGFVHMEHVFEVQELPFSTAELPREWPFLLLEGLELLAFEIYN